MRSANFRNQSPRCKVKRIQQPKLVTHALATANASQVSLQPAGHEMDGMRLLTLTVHMQCACMTESLWSLSGIHIFLFYWRHAQQIYTIVRFKEDILFLLPNVDIKRWPQGRILRHLSQISLQNAMSSKPQCEKRHSWVVLYVINIALALLTQITINKNF
jgi:hypothetical protein